MKKNNNQILESCPLCDGAVKLSKSDWVRSTKPLVTVKSFTSYTCEDCGERFLTPELGKKLDQETNEALRRAKNLLTSKEITDLTKKIFNLTKLPESTIAIGLGVGRQELFRWKTGERIQSKIADAFMRFVAEDTEQFSKYLLSAVGEPKKRGPKKKKAADRRS